MNRSKGDGATKRQPLVIAVANQKGGVGKTTITRELAGSVALRGYSVLMIDCDRQGNLTESYVLPENVDFTLSQVLIDPPQTRHEEKISSTLPLSDAVIQTKIPGLDLVPADETLAAYEFAKTATLFRLKTEIETHAKDYDLVFLDCPPHFGMILTAALHAAHYVVIPTVANAMGPSGLGELAYTIGEVRRGANRELKALGAILNLYKQKRKLSAAAEEAIGRFSQRENIPVFQTRIHDYTEIAESPSELLPTSAYRKNSQGARQLWLLTTEFLNQLGLPEDIPNSPTFQFSAKTSQEDKKAEESNSSVDPSPKKEERALR